MSRTESELKGVTFLGNTATRYPDQYAPEVLETFKNTPPHAIRTSMLRRCLKHSRTSIRTTNIS